MTSRAGLASQTWDRYPSQIRWVQTDTSASPPCSKMFGESLRMTAQGTEERPCVDGGELGAAGLSAQDHRPPGHRHTEGRRAPEAPPWDAPVPPRQGQKLLPGPPDRKRSLCFCSDWLMGAGLLLGRKKGAIAASPREGVEVANTRPCSSGTEIGVLRGNSGPDGPPPGVTRTRQGVESAGS